VNVYAVAVRPGLVAALAYVELACEHMLEIFVVVLLILLNGLFALGELALVSVNRTRIAMLERKGLAGAAQARVLSDDPQLFLPAVQIGITAVGILSGVFGGARLAGRLEPVLADVPQLAPYADTLSLALVVVVITYLTLVLGELVPKQIALRNPEKVAAAISRPLIALTRVTRPIVWLLNTSSQLILRLGGVHDVQSNTVTEEELKALLVEGEETGVLETEERDMIERVMRLADKPVRAIMTPRTELSWIDRTDKPEEIAAAIKAAAHSRFVVCDSSIDNVVGIVLAKDILDLVLDGKPPSIAAVLRQPLVMPDTVTAMDALEQLKADPLGLALVMDEYGSFEGLVTAADVLEAIVGAAVAAQDVDAQAESERLGVYQLDGMMPVDELKSRLDLPDLPAEGSYHTLAGLVLALLRRVPRQGDRIVFGGWLFEVVEMDGRRVDRVRATREAQDEV